MTQSGMWTRWTVGVLLAAPFSPMLHAQSPGQPATIQFNRDIRPILSDNCYFCHGPDQNKRKADLRLDTREGLFSTLSDHRTVVPGKPDDSELYRRLITHDPQERMPDPKSNKRLSGHDIALIRRWIEQGAPWQGHWAYLPLTSPTPPAVDGAPAHHPVDAFILARLKEAGLSPAAPADRVTLIRRVSQDLCGLPPTPAEVKAFVDDASPDAYEKVVDRLLASPHFGERMGVFWLDLVRFADTIGYHSDNPMNVSPFRDYVIDSFNANKPFDQFTIEQLAGDLLANPTPQQRVATAYNRLLQTTEEGGAQAREYEVKNLTDRVRNVSTVWLAATMGCCQCHDHKFDPLTMKDFYSMAAFFADVQEATIGRREPGMLMPTPEQQRKLDELDSAIAAEKLKLNVPDAALADEEQSWEAGLRRHPVQWTTLQASSASTSGPAQLRPLPDGSFLLVGKPPAKDVYTFETTLTAGRLTGLRIEALPDGSFSASGPGAADNGNFVLTGVKIELQQSKGRPRPVALAKAFADYSQPTFAVESLLTRRGAGWAVMPSFGQPHAAIFEFTQPLKAQSGATLKVALEFQSPFPGHQIGRVRLSTTAEERPAETFSIPENVRDALAADDDERSDKEQATVMAYFRTIAPSLEPIRRSVAAIEKQKESLSDQMRKCLVTTSGTPRTVRLLHRGNWQDTTGAAMAPAIPAILASGALQQEANGRRLNRLDLARWIVSRNNPLTARVYVNRIWRLCFGMGLSKITDDLGSQGEWPTHPELLDYLANDFVDHGWDTKRLFRLLVTSQTYRQSSQGSELAREKDPYNRLLARQSRWRIDAEFVRDNALSVSGLLVDRVGGQSVKPYQPEGYWVQLNFPTRTYVADKGDDQYRRGLYTWWQRSFLHPSLLAFDAPSREEGVCERNRSNIPQQALVLLNDPTYVEASRALAARVMKEGGDATLERLKFAYQVVLSRPPREEEITLLTALLQKHRAEYEQSPQEAQKLLRVGNAPAPSDTNPAELAAWTSICRVILNLSETITRM